MGENKLHQLKTSKSKMKPGCVKKKVKIRSDNLSAFVIWDVCVWLWLVLLNVYKKPEWNLDLGVKYFEWISIEVLINT